MSEAFSKTAMKQIRTISHYGYRVSLTRYDLRVSIWLSLIVLWNIIRRTGFKVIGLHNTKRSKKSVAFLRSVIYVTPILQGIVYSIR